MGRLVRSFATLAGLLAVIIPTAQAAEELRPNVIVIMTDDQGTADLHIAGAADLETPSLDALARRGVRFAQFYAAAPVCSPARRAAHGKEPRPGGYARQRAVACG